MRFILIDELRQQNCINHLLNIALDGKTEVVFRDAKSKRSLDQNALMWKYYEYISDYTGYTSDELHEMMKAKVFGIKELKTKDLSGNPITLHIPDGSTAKLDVKRMTDFIRAIELLAVDIGVSLPIPDYYNNAMKG